MTLEQGTGIVHSSPAYGVDDFESCRRYGMADDDILNPVQGDGRYAASLPLFGGLKIWDANPKIVDKLREAGALLHAEKFTHSYMHCWRHKTPIIYRATTQWFAGMDDVPGYRRRKPAETLRATALRGIEATAVLSGVGQGAPVRHDRQPPRLDAVAPAAMGRAAAVLRRQGNRRAASGHAGAARARRARRSSAAASRPGSTPTHEDFGVDPAKYRKITDTLDVWFDSGSTHQTVLGGPQRSAGSHPATGFPPTSISKAPTSIAAGSIRRCSSRACSTACRRTRRCSRTASPSTAKARRCRSRRATSSRRRRCRTRWAPKSCACGSRATDYSGDLSISDEILKRVVESYRRIRNTLRFLLANTADFDPAQRRGRRSTSCSRSTATRSRRRTTLVDAVAADYARYEFHLVVQRLQTYCSEDLGGFYLDVLKDRLYTAAATSRARGARRRRRCALIRDALLKADGADPVVHRRGGVARSCIPSDPTIFVHVSWSDALPEVAGADALLAKWHAHPRRARGGAEGAGERCARTARSARRCRPK